MLGSCIVSTPAFCVLGLIKPRYLPSVYSFAQVDSVPEWEVHCTPVPVLNQLAQGSNCWINQQVEFWSFSFFASKTLHKVNLPVG